MEEPERRLTIIGVDPAVADERSEHGGSPEDLFDEFPDFVSTRRELEDRLDDLVPDIDAASREDCRDALELIDRAIGYLMMVKVVTRAPRFEPIVWDLRERIRAEKAAIIELRRPFRAALDEDAARSGTSTKAIMDGHAARRQSGTRRWRWHQADVEAFYEANAERFASDTKIVLERFDEWLAASPPKPRW